MKRTRQLSNWSSETKEKILDLWHSGKGSVEIARALDLPVTAPTPVEARVSIFIARERRRGNRLATRRQERYARNREIS